MQIVASPAALRRIRHELARELPGIKRAHLAEGLAASIGFASNAAWIAWITNLRKHELALRTVDPGAFVARLDEVGAPADPGLVGEMRLSIVLSRAILVADAAADWTPYAELTPTNPAWPFAHAMMLLDKTASRDGQPDPLWQMDSPDLTSRHSIRHLVAAGAHRHADADPEIAAFLIDWMQDAHMRSIRGSGSTAWGLPIYSTFVRRIRTFRDAACRRWGDDVTADDLPVPPRPRRDRPPRPHPGVPKYPDILVSTSTSRVDGATSLFDAGWPPDSSDATQTALPGLIMFSLWRAGVPKEELCEIEERHSQRWGMVGLVGRRWEMTGLVDVDAPSTGRPLRGGAQQQ